MRWWGWGEDAHAGALPDARAGAAARASSGVGGAAPRGRSPSRTCGCPSRALPDGVLDRLRGVGASVRDDREARVAARAGKGYPDLVRLRAGDAEDAPDAVVLPRDARRGRARCSRSAPTRGVAVVPFGGGTSVVGGVEPLRERLRGA